MSQHSKDLDVSTRNYGEALTRKREKRPGSAKHLNLNKNPCARWLGTYNIHNICFSNQLELASIEKGDAMQNPLTSPLRFVSCEDSKQKLAALRHYWMKADSRW